MKSMTVKGKPASDEASRVCVLFDPKDGRVVHVHGVTVAPGGAEVGAAEMEARASRHARAFGCSVEGLKALHLPYSALRGYGGLRVNEEGSGLVAVEGPGSLRDRVAKTHRPA